jgi:hypothetical protein
MNDLSLISFFCCHLNSEILCAVQLFGLMNFLYNTRSTLVLKKEHALYIIFWVQPKENFLEYQKKFFLKIKDENMRLQGCRNG